MPSSYFNHAPKVRALEVVGDADCKRPNLATVEPLVQKEGRGPFPPVVHRNLALHGQADQGFCFAVFEGKSAAAAEQDIVVEAVEYVQRTDEGHFEFDLFAPREFDEVVFDFNVAVQTERPPVAEVVVKIEAPRRHEEHSVAPYFGDYAVPEKDRRPERVLVVVRVGRLWCWVFTAVLSGCSKCKQGK